MDAFTAEALGWLGFSAQEHRRLALLLRQYWLGLGGHLPGKQPLFCLYSLFSSHRCVEEAEEVLPPIWKTLESSENSKYTSLARG